MNPVLIVDECDGVATLTLNRPAARNALDLDLTETLQAELERAGNAPEIHAVVLTGTPPAFCAGLDIKAFSAPDAPRHRVSELINSLPNFGKPIIAAVNGAAMTGGMELALACDFIIAGESARFGDTHLRIGALSGSGMGSRLPVRVGAAWARQISLTCLPVDSATALRIGLVNEVVADEMIVQRARALASAMAAFDPELLSLTRSVISRGEMGTLAEAIDIERDTLAARKAKAPMAWKD